MSHALTSWMGPSSMIHRYGLIFSLTMLSPSITLAITDDDLRHSEWETNYEALGGGRVEATVVFDDDEGLYDTADGRGRLSNVKYKINITGGATITGNWSFGDASGKFTFFVTGNTHVPAFSGAWQTNGRSGNWNGRFAGVAQAPQGGGEVVYDDTWSYNDVKDYYYKTCRFPAGGYQYVIFFKNKPNWIYWYNPASAKFWCACPTVNHPRWGEAVKEGKDLFLKASQPARDIEDCEFPDAGDDGANFAPGKTKDKDGSTVDLGCPPPDLP